MPLTDSETDPGVEISGSDRSESEEEQDLVALLKNAGWRIARRRRKKGVRKTDPPVECKAKSEGCSPNGCGCRVDSSVDCKVGSVGALIEVKTGSINGLNGQADPWEPIDFLVDSGASATVVGESMVQAVEASSPDPE